MVRKKRTPMKPSPAATPAVVKQGLASCNLNNAAGSVTAQDTCLPPAPPDLEMNRDSPSVELGDAAEERQSSKSAGTDLSGKPSENLDPAGVSQQGRVLTGINLESAPHILFNAAPSLEQNHSAEQSHPQDPASSSNGQLTVPQLTSPDIPVSNAGQGKLSPPGLKKKTWADCVAGKEYSLQPRGETYKLPSGDTCVTIPNEVISRNKKVWTSFVIGQFHGTLPSMGSIHAILNGIWSSKNRDITISRSGKQSILIKIPNSVTRKRVLDQGIWHIEGQSMFVGEWEPGLTPELPELKEVPVWVDFRGVPPHFFSKEGFEYIAGMVGYPLQLHPRTAAMTNLEVARVFTLVDLRQPLPEAVYVRFESGETHKIDVSCPWLPPLCAHCQLYGHSLRRCPTAPVTCQICKSTTHVDKDCLRGKRKQQNQEARRASPKPTNRSRPFRATEVRTDNTSRSLAKEPETARDKDEVVVLPASAAQSQKQTLVEEQQTIQPLTKDLDNGNAMLDKDIASQLPSSSNYPSHPATNLKTGAEWTDHPNPSKPNGKGHLQESSSESSTSDSDLENFPKLPSKQVDLQKGTKKPVTLAKKPKGRGPLLKNNP